jgi:hypothetical protein
MPWRSAMRTDSALRAWAAMRMFDALATSAAAATSASVMGVWSGAAELVTPRSPDRCSLNTSTPSRANMRQARRMSSAPSTMVENTVSRFHARCGWLVSPRPPVTVSSVLQAR